MLNQWPQFAEYFWIKKKSTRLDKTYLTILCECCQFEREGGRGREICPQYRQQWFSKHKQSISNLQNELSMESCEHEIFHFSCWVAIRREKNHSFTRKECSCHPLINFHYWVSDFQSWICLVKKQLLLHQRTTRSY